MSTAGEWVLLSYRLPREPSTPRITVWRKLERLGVARLGDGLVGLPADARTREQLEWIADEVLHADGSATVWLARPASVGQEREIAAAMRAARAEEYRTLVAKAATETTSALSVRRLRAELRRIERRDFFPPPEREAARAAVHAVAHQEEAR